MSQKDKHDAHIFYADSRFERLARRPGGMPREQALARAQAEIDELKPGFGNWLDQELRELSAEISQIESNPGDTSVLDRAHSRCAQLQDIGTTMGFELVTFVANSLCKIFDAIKAGAIYDKDMIDCHVSALFLFKTEPYRDLRPDQVPEMSNGLRQVVALANRGSRKGT
jgi:chemotaxis protein histidine kinase CheA